MPRRKTKRNLKKRGGVGSKRIRSPSFSEAGPSRKKSRSTPYVTSTVPAFGSSSLTLGDFTPTPPFSPSQRLPRRVEWGYSHGAHGRHRRRSLSDPRHSTSNTRRMILPYRPRMLMPTAETEDSGPMNQRVENLIKNIEETQIRMDNQQIPTADWEQYKIDNHPITIDSVNGFLVNQEDKIRDFYNKEQQRQQDGIRQNKKIMKQMLSKTGKRTGIMTLALLATLMANDLYTDKPTGIPPYQRLIADTPADIVNKATGNGDGLIPGVEVMDENNPDYFIINTKSGEKIFFNPSTTTLDQWHEAKKKAILQQKPFSIYDDQDAVNFFLEKGNKDLLGIALKKISPRQKQLLEQARRDEIAKKAKRARERQVRGAKPHVGHTKNNRQDTKRGRGTRRGTGRGR